jgi:hypothetical protein
MCWWISSADSQADQSVSDNMCAEEVKCFLRQDSGYTKSTMRSSLFSRDDSFDSSDSYRITGFYSDITVSYSISSRVFGSGRYGTVSQCTHFATGEQYAVKTIEKSKVGNLGYMEREVQMLSKMNHGNIIKMIDCYEDIDYVHIVTEQCTGGELFDKIVAHATEDGCLPELETARIIKQLLNAVSYLHENDCVHRGKYFLIQTNST